MSQIVNFNGARLVKPGGATKLDASAFEGVVTEGVGTIAVVGEAKNGVSGQWLAFTSASAMEQYFQSGDLADAASVAFKPLNDARVGDAHAQTVLAYKTNSGTQAAKVLQDGSSNDVMRLTTVDYNAAANATSVAVAYSNAKRVFSITPPSTVTETRSQETISVTDSECEKLTLYYAGASGSTVTVSTTDNATADGLIDVITLNSSVAGETLAIDLVALQLGSIKSLVDYINGRSTVWVAAVGASKGDQYKFSPRLLDSLSTVTVPKTSGSPLSVYAKLQQCLDRINAESRIVTVAFPVGSVRAAPAATATVQAFSGGTDGTSSGTALSEALLALEALDAPQVVVLKTDSASATLLEAHCAKMSATGADKKERTGYAGLTGTKSELISAAQTINSQHIALFCNKWTKVDRSGNVVVLPEWAWALAAASARAGLQPGEPLTWKYFASQNVTQASSTWSPENDGDDMVLAGLCIAQKDRRGCKILKGITSYTRFDNDVFTEESIITNVKAMAKEFRELLEQRYTGRMGMIQTVANIRSDALEFWGQKREQGRIVDSVVNGAITQLAYRKLEVSLVKDTAYVDIEISPVQGINFQLETIRLVPATISL